MSRFDTKSKAVHKLVSAVWLIVCFALISHAFALYHDQIQNSQNQIKSGKLSARFWCSDTLLENQELANRQDLANPGIQLFSEYNWMPGQTCVRYLQVENTGNLPLDYRIHFSVTDEGLGSSLLFSIRPLNSQAIVENTDHPQSILGNELQQITLSNSNLSPYSSQGDLYEIICRYPSSSLVSTPSDQQFRMDISLLVMQTGISQPNGIVCAKRLEDLIQAPSHSTVFLMNDIHSEEEEISLGRLINLDLNGCTLFVKTLSIHAEEDSAAMGIINGSIKTNALVPGESCGMVIHAPKASVHFTDFLGTALVNGVLYENGIPPSDVEVPPNVDGIYRIENLRQLRWLSQEVNNGDSFSGKEIHLMNDIDLGQVPWTPIGQPGTPFSGTFDGNGFVIKNLNISSTEEECGLFGNVQGILRNVGLDGVTITGSGKVGALVGNCSGVVEHCTVKHATLQGQGQMGGLIGYSSAEITGCNIYDSSITCSHSAAHTGCAIGGCVGDSAEGEQTISGCLIRRVTVTGCTDVGGLMGIRNSGICVTNCQVTNSMITARPANDEQIAYAGSLIGRAYEIYMWDPSESDSTYGQKVFGNKIEDSVSTLAEGIHAQANMYNDFTGYLEPVEW